MSKLLIVAASIYCIAMAGVAYAQQCKMTQCTTTGTITTCVCVAY